MTTAIAITNSERQEMTAILAENMGGEALSMQDLLKVKVPSAGSTTWEIPVGDNEMEPSRFIEGVIIAQIPHRIYFQENTTGEKNPPACTSEDGVTGYGTPGGSCKNCAFAKFGSKGRGQACSARMNLYIMRDEDFLPIVIDLPPSSLTTLKKYMTQLATLSRKPFYAVRTKLTLKRLENPGGKAYSVVQFSMAGKLDEDEAANSRGMKTMFLDMLQASARQKQENDPAIQEAWGPGEFDQGPIQKQKPPKVVDADDQATF